MSGLRTLLLLILAWPTLAWSQDMLVQPDLFDVTGVASNDVLNIRQGPSASTPIIGALAYNQGGVEVIGTTRNGRWGLVNSGERSGWVSMRYMTRSYGWSRNPPGELLCLGTEPFWSFHFDPSNQAVADFSPMGLGFGQTVYHAYWSAPVSNRATQTYGFVTGPESTNSGLVVNGIVRTELCSDGMSEQAFGFSVDLVLSGTSRSVVSGCCRIQSH